MVVLFVFAIAGQLFVGLTRAREVAEKVSCASNLRQVAVACSTYADRCAGRFPDAVEALYESGDLVPASLVCRASGATPAAGPTTRATAAQLAGSPPPGAPGCCRSYVYAGAGLTARVARRSPTVVLAYEPASNHGGRGGNVVYADGHHEWHSAASLARVIAAVQVGRNPPP